MTGNPLVILAVTVLLLACSAFFVAIEFAALAAKRHRLQDQAANSRAARAALRNSTELTVLLAGSQLGITICTLALGAVTKPAVHYWLTPLFETLGIGAWAADAAGFLLALLAVTFLHLVVGEMAPKSWAIAHPEASATLLAVPMRAFMYLTRPALKALNAAANQVLRAAGVEPTDQLGSGQNAADLRHLVEHSASVGALDAEQSHRLGDALDLQVLTVADLLRPGSRPTAVPITADVADVQNATRASGHLRILVGDAGDVAGVVHVRDTLKEPQDRPATELMRPALALAPDTPVYSALATMRETRNHLAVVDVAGTTGVITLADVLTRLFPRDKSPL